MNHLAVNGQSTDPYDIQTMATLVTTGHTTASTTNCATSTKQRRHTMNIKPIPCIIVLAVATLCGYGFYATTSHDPNHLLLTIGSSLSLALTLIGTLALNVKGQGGTGNTRILSLIFFVIFLLSNIIFSFVAQAQAPYIIVNGIILLVYLLIVYSIVEATK